MLNVFFLIKTLHIISATILFGTGIGIAFFMWRSYFTPNIQEKLYAAKTTVLADYCFTLPAVIIQPITGICLIWINGHDWQALWLMLSYILYFLIGLCWVPVVFIQIKLKKLLVQSIVNHNPLPTVYHRLFRIWFLLGWPAFISLILIFLLMVFKPI